MPQTTVTLANGRELDVEWELEPASGDGWNSPRTGEHIEILSVTVGWIDAETADTEDVEILALLWHARMLEANDRIAMGIQ